MEVRHSQDSFLQDGVDPNQEAQIEDDRITDQYEDGTASEGHQSSSWTRQSSLDGNEGDINAAAALRAQYAIDISEPSRGGRRRRNKKSVATTSTTASSSSQKSKSIPIHSHDNVHTPTDSTETRDTVDDEPLVDNTVILPLHSKKTSRLQRKQERRSAQALLQSQSLGPIKASLLTIPTELLFLILSHLRPSDIPNVHLVCSSLHNYLNNPTTNTLLSTSIIQSRYWVLSRCFPLPIPFHTLDTPSQTALLLPKRQELMSLHRKSYRQHILPIDPEEVCTCLTCVFAWNNLCLILDLNHWQKNLDHSEPIPMIKRGRNPDWNVKLLERNAEVVRRSMKDPMVYAWILERHLATTTGTILRNSRWESHRRNIHKRSGGKTSVEPPPQQSQQSSSSQSIYEPQDLCSPDYLLATTTTTTNQTSKHTTHRQRTYDLTPPDVDRETDEYLERKGPASYDFPFHRDNYYDIETYLPNRKWNPGSRRWGYYANPPAQHEKDLEWVRGFSVRSRELWRGILDASGGRRNG